MKLFITLLSSLLLTASIAVAKPSTDTLGSAPAFTLADQDGKNVSLDDFKGKIVVLEWVNPQCPFVKRHHKAGTMSSLAQKFADKNVTWLAINSTHFMGAEENKKFREEYGITYPVLTDASGQVGQSYGAKTTPFMVVIDSNGQTVYRGAIDDDAEGEKSSPVNYVHQALTQLTSGQAIAVNETKSYGCSVKYKS